MKNKLPVLIICFFSGCLSATAMPSASAPEGQEQAAMEYFLGEVERDSALAHEERHEKIREFKAFEDQLSPEVSYRLTLLLLEESRARVIEMFQQADLDELEIKNSLADFDKAVLSFQTMDVETARQILFFVAELKIHREYVYEFGVALGCPEKQLLRHDLCKLNAEQLEGYARYFRGGRQEEDKLAYLAAWQEHQLEEHHHECYSNEFDFDNFPKERLRYNMLEAVADLLASTKQRGGTTLTDWLLNRFPRKNPHPRLIPYLEEALIKAHAFYLESDSYPIFRGLPCWNHEIAELFSTLKKASLDSQLSYQ
jgi:hypothetical protein